MGGAEGCVRDVARVAGAVLHWLIHGRGRFSERVRAWESNPVSSSGRGKEERGGGGWGWEVGHGEAVVRDETSGFAAALSAVRGQALCAIARAVGRGNGVGREGGSRHATGAVCVCVFFFFFFFRFHWQGVARVR